MRSDGGEEPEKKDLKPVLWIGDSRKAVRRFPDEVQSEMGHALYIAQTGDKAPNAKPLKGFGGTGVLEIVEDYRGDTFRAVYTVRFQEAVFILHVFQKKSKHGVATPKHDMDLIKERLKTAVETYDALKARGEL